MYLSIQYLGFQEAVTEIVFSEARADEGNCTIYVC